MSAINIEPMATQTANFPAPGDVFESRYQIERLIGSGGFSRVYLATQTDLGRRVALKVMLAEKSRHSIDGSESEPDSHGLAERFLQEARVVSKLRDPHTVTVHDHGRTKDGHFFMVLEFVDGKTLSQVVKAEGAMDPRRVANILTQTLESLHEAHLLGLLHRDVKPANIMLYDHIGRKDNVKVLDFGIAKFVQRGAAEEEAAEDLTRSGSILGTPRYMSPEQLRADPVGPASDIYSLGLVAYEMLMGKKAIDSNSSVVIIGQQLAARPFAVPNVPHIPPRIRMIVNRMLAKETENRYPSAEAVLADLNQVNTGMFTGVQMANRQPNLTPMPEFDDLPDISDSIEMIDIIAPEPAEPKISDRTVKLAGIFLIISVLVLLIAVVVKKAKPEAEPVLPPVAEIKPPEVPVVIAKVEPKDTAPKFDNITIDTGATKAKIFVNGKPSGTSPVVVATSEVHLPLRIRAVAPGGGERLVVLDSLVETVDIDLTELATQAAPPKPTPEVEEPKPKPKPKPYTRPKPKPKPEPEPEAKDPKKLTLPALDY